MVIQRTSSQDKLLANLLAQSLAMASGRDHGNPNKRFAGNRPNSILLADRLTHTPWARCWLFMRRSSSCKVLSGISIPSIRRAFSLARYWLQKFWSI